MSPNHLLIGLGGTGGKILRSFRKIAYRASRSLQPEGVSLEYLYIDSSDEMMGRTDHSWKVMGESVQIPVTSQLHLKSADLPSRLKNIDSYPNIQGWIGDPALWNDILNIGSGAKILGGQKRRLGRFLFACHVNDFIAQLTGKMELLTKGGHHSSAGHSQVTVHIFSGLAGGTGSGCLIDVIAQIRKLYPANCQIFLYLLLPDRNPKVGWNQGNYHANGYAALMELNALSVGVYKPYDLAGNGNRVTQLVDPFNACYLITNENESDPPLQFDVDKAIPDTVAMFLYQKIVAQKSVTQKDTPGEGVVQDDTKWPDLKRIEAWENQKLQPESEDSSIPERSRLFIAFGMKQISYPEEEISDYLSSSLSQHACLQLLYNNWGRLYLNEPGNFSAVGHVAQPQLLDKWKVTREYLFLEKQFSHEQVDEEQSKWRKLDDKWREFIDRVLEDLKDTDGNTVALLRRKCQEWFDSGYAGGEGVKGFYQRRLSRVDEYAAIIAAVIEHDLLQDVFAGKRSLYDGERILVALGDYLDKGADEWKKYCDRAIVDAAKAKEKVSRNIEEYECMGAAARMFGLRQRIQEAAKANLFDYYRSASTAEAWTFVEAMLRALQLNVMSSRDALKRVIANIQTALKTCAEKCQDSKPNEIETDIAGVWVRLYSAKEVDDYLQGLVMDEEFQKIQAGRARDAIKCDVLKDRLSMTALASVSQDDLLDCLEKTSQPALREAGAAAAISSNSAGKKLTRLLSVSIVEKLAERYSGNPTRMTNEIHTFIQTAKNFVRFSQAQEYLRGPGTSEGNMQPSLAIAMPRDKSETTQKLEKAFVEACAGVTPVFVDTGDRRRHEITLLSFKQLFPLRFVSALEFLKEEYDRAIVSSSNTTRTKMELHTEGDAKMYPLLYVPQATEICLPKILAGMALDVIKPRQSDSTGNGDLRGDIYLSYFDSDARDLSKHQDLGKGYRDAVRMLVNNSNTLGLLKKEVGLAAAKLGNEESKLARERVIRLVDDLSGGDGAARAALAEAAEQAILLVDPGSK